jgi:hypothetical protein
MSDDVSTSLGRPVKLLTRFAVAAALFLGAVASVAPAQAHGRLGAAEGRCKLFIGPDTMNFTGYLPEASKNEFCEDIPSTGPMIMVLDAEQAELRDMKIELRIVKDVGAAASDDENLEPITVAYKEPRYYPSGTVNFEHNFKEGGYFVGIVTVLGDHGERWVSRFPFSVDRTFMRDLPVYLTLALGVIAAFVIYLVHRRRNPPPTLVNAAAAFKAPDPALWADVTDETKSSDEVEPESGPDKPASDKGDDDHDDSDKYRTAAE